MFTRCVLYPRSDRWESGELMHIPLVGESTRCNLLANDLLDYHGKSALPGRNNKQQGCQATEADKHTWGSRGWLACLWCTHTKSNGTRRNCQLGKLSIANLRQILRRLNLLSRNYTQLAVEKRHLYLHIMRRIQGFCGIKAFGCCDEYSTGINHFEELNQWYQIQKRP